MRRQAWLILPKFDQRDVISFKLQRVDYALNYRRTEATMYTSYFREATDMLGQKQYKESQEVVAHRKIIRLKITESALHKLISNNITKTRK